MSTLNFEAEEYLDMIGWSHVEISEPPLTSNILDDELNAMILEVSDEIDIVKYPCHTQAVERCIKLVTEASAAVCGHDARDGFIRSRIASRNALPTFENKRQVSESYVRTSKVQLYEREGGWWNSICSHLHVVSSGLFSERKQSKSCIKIGNYFY